MRVRLALCTIAITLSLAAPAPAQNGEGLLGETDDRVVTFFAFGVLLFFPLVALIGTALQSRLEHRREEREERDAARYERPGAA